MVADTRRSKSPETLRRTRDQFSASGFDDAQWTSFLLTYAGDVDALIAAQVKVANDSAAAWRGTPPIIGAGGDETALVADDADLTKLPLALLEAEISRLERHVSADRDKANKFAAISKRIQEETTALAKAQENLVDYEQAPLRIPQLVAEREASYERIVEAIVAEEQVLRTLYAPLQLRLTAEGGTLSKLSFSVRRVADIEAWATEGENLLDLRKQGAFRGRGQLAEVARSALKAAWETGNAATVKNALSQFRQEHEQDLLSHSPVLRERREEYRAWLKRFARWLYDTSHITVRYDILYDGVEIQKLSPGTRGIVLLLMYLALDIDDDRPLVIDQPEENLDPKSIYDELVQLFMRAKERRQVIMVTHNANLVINTDADQIIVASCGPHRIGELPAITYTSGGLENATIRSLVCDILEGGDHAFRERARRLRVRLDR